MKIPSKHVSTRSPHVSSGCLDVLFDRLELSVNELAQPLPARAHSHFVLPPQTVERCSELVNANGLPCLRPRCRRRLASLGHVGDGDGATRRAPECREAAQRPRAARATRTRSRFPHAPTVSAAIVHPHPGGRLDSSSPQRAQQLLRQIPGSDSPHHRLTVQRAPRPWGPRRNGFTQLGGGHVARLKARATLARKRDSDQSGPRVTQRIRS